MAFIFATPLSLFPSYHGVPAGTMEPFSNHQVIFSTVV